jgi:hypothetical protein
MDGRRIWKKTWCCLGEKVLEEIWCIWTQDSQIEVAVSCCIVIQKIICVRKPSTFHSFFCVCLYFSLRSAGTDNRINMEYSATWKLAWFYSVWATIDFSIEFYLGLDHMFRVIKLKMGLGVVFVFSPSTTIYSFVAWTHDISCWSHSSHRVVP